MDFKCLKVFLCEITANVSQNSYSIIAFCEITNPTKIHANCIQSSGELKIVYK